MAMMPIFMFLIHKSQLPKETSDKINVENTTSSALSTELGATILIILLL